MEPISLVANIGSIIQLSIQAAQCLKEIKHGPEDRIRLRQEIRGTSCLLQMLQDRIEDADSNENDLTSIKKLKFPGGPLDQLNNALYDIVEKLAPKDRLRQMSRTIFWPFSKKDVVDLIETVERQKRAFNLAIQNDAIGLSLAIKSQVTALDEKLMTIDFRQEDSFKKDADREFQTITAWLSPLNFWARQHDIISTRTEETGIWLLESPEFQSWRNGSNKILWCHGIPGAGKTVLASVVVENLAHSFADGEQAFAFAYCNYKERAQQTFGNLISGLIRQLLCIDTTIPEQLRQLYQRHSNQATRPNHSELLGLLNTVASRFTSLFFVIDALDECDDSDGTRSTFIPKLRKALPKACVLVTSRPLRDIEIQFEDCPRLEIRATDHDIRRYISSQVQQEPRLRRHLEADPSLLTLIEETIVCKSDGMFLLAQLHIGALANKHTRKALRPTLQNLPSQLDKTYDEALQRINDQNHEDASLARDVLLWVSLASNPLSVVELQHAIATMSLDGETELGDEDLPESDILIAVCAGIVVVDKESNVVRLVHYTTQEYLQRNPLIHLSVAQCKITKTCITYLSLDPFTEGPCDGNEALRIRFETYPFIGYAAQNWGNHARGVPEEDCQEQILEFLSKKDLTASALQAANAAPEYPTLWAYWCQHYPTGVPSLAIAAAFGLTGIVRCLLREGLDIDASSETGRTALMFTAEEGHTDTVKALLEAGADINKADAAGATALMAAAREGHDKAVKVLLDNGAKLETATIYGDTALRGATRRGFCSTAKLLLDRGAEIKANQGLLEAAIESGNAALIDLVSSKIDEVMKSDDIKLSLHHCLYRRRPLIANLEMLIEKGASLTQFDRLGDTPIHLAAARGHLDAIRLLLNYGVEPNLNTRCTPLHRATFRGNLETVDFLLNHGADITAQNDTGETALHTCIHYKPHDDVVSFLMEKAIPLDIMDAQGNTALHAAASRGYDSVVEILIDYGADVNLKNQWGWTPVQEAAASGHEQVVGQLLTQMATACEPTPTTLLASARLRAAINSKEDQIIEELLEKPDIDVGLPDHDGRTSLHHAAYNGQMSIVQALLERGVSVHAKIADSAYEHMTSYLGHIPDEAYECQWVTPLHNASGKGHAEIVKLLLEYGADINAAGSEGYRAFSVAVHEGHASVAQILLEHGAQVSETDRENWPTPLYWSAIQGYEDVVRLLLENGADEERHTEDGIQALALALQFKHTGTVELLKKHGFRTAER